MSDISSAERRKLPFPLYDALSIRGNTPDEIISFPITDVFPVDPDERINIKIELSLNEYVALASAVDVGRDIAFGTDSTFIWWLWTRIFKGLADSMSCEDVADCVESEIVTNVTLQNSINSYIASSGFGDPNHVNPDVTTILDRNPVNYQKEPIDEEFEECNLDALWGAIRHGIVQRLDDSTRDMLEDLNNVANLAMRVAVWLDTVPILGDIAEALAFQAAAVIPDLLNLYNSYSSEETMDEIACDIFSIVCEDCRFPTFEDVFNYYFTFGVAGMPSPEQATLNALMDALINSANAVPKAAYFTLTYWYLMVLNLNAAIAGNSGTRTLLKWARLGEDFANDNWLDLCDACGEQYMEYVFDFTKEQYGSYRTGNFSGSIMSGDYIAGTGWRVSAINNTDGLMQVGLPLQPSWIMVAVALQTTATPSGAPSFFRPTIQSSSGQSAANLDTADAPYSIRSNFVNTPKTNMKEYAIRLPGTLASGMTLEKIAMKFQAGNAPLGSTPVASPDYPPVV